MIYSELLSTEPDDKRYYQLLKLECLKAVVLDAEDVDTAIAVAKMLFRSITEEKWGSSDKTEAGDDENR